MRKKLKICVISRGNLVHIYPYLNSFVEFGHEVVLLAITPTNRNVDKKIRIINLLDEQVSNKNLIDKISFIGSYIGINKIVKQEKPDIVHAHYLTSGGYASFFLPKNIPFFITIHGSDILLRNNFIFQILNKLVLKRADYIQCVSKQVENKVINYIGINKKMFSRTIGVDVKNYKLKKNILNKNEKIKIISTRNFEDVYNPTYILQNLLELKRSGFNFKMVFIGDGSLLKNSKEFVNNNLSKVVEFKGKLSHNDLMTEIYRSDFYISASSSDGTSISLLEAMSIGLIPIISDIEANRDWVVQDTGLYFDLNYQLGLFNAFNDKIINVISNSEMIRMKNRKAVEERADRYNNMKLIEGVFFNLVKK